MGLPGFTKGRSGFGAFRGAGIFGSRRLVSGSDGGVVVPPLSISGDPGGGEVGTGSTFTPTIAGGTPPYTLSLASGTLPPGRTINGSARTVTGAYTTAGSYSYVLRVTDAAARTADLAVSVTVVASQSWYTAGATEFDYQSTPARFRKGGVEYATEADFWAALVATDIGGYAVARNVSSGKREFGRFVKPGITNEIVNASFLTDVSAWAPGQSSGGPATLQWAAPDEMQIVANGATLPRASQAFQTVRSKAYLAAYAVGRGTDSVTSVRALVGTLGGSTVVSGGSGMIGLTEGAFTFGAVGDGIQLYANVVAAVGGAAAGFNRCTHYDIWECVPFNGFQQGQVSGRLRLPLIDAADLSGTKIYASWDSGAQDGGASSPVVKNRIEIRSVNGALAFYGTSERTIGAAASTEFNIALGALAAGTRPVVEFAVTDGIASANRDGAAPVQSTIQFMPGVAMMRLHGGQTPTTNDTANRDSWLTLYDTLTFPQGYPAPSTFVNQGDSYGRIGPYVTTATGGALVGNSRAAGGITLDDILDRVLARPDLWGKPTLLWDGKPNGFVSKADYKAKVKRIGDAVGWANFVFIPSLKTKVGSAENATIDLVQAAFAELKAENGGYLIDAQALLNDGSGVANPNYIEPPPDQVHVNAAGNAIVAGSPTTVGTIAWAFKQMGAY